MFNNQSKSIGAVFTPQKWGKFAIEKFNLFDKWLNGNSIFDPTMGIGNLLFALIEYGIEKGFNVKDLPIYNLYGCELNTKFYNLFFERAKKIYNIKLPKENYLNEDIFFIKNEKKFDILFGNPPWQNFVDLPKEYKLKIKDLFIEYDLVENSKNLLLGNSRIDISALVLKKTIQTNLNNNGEAIFFIPLSLFLNDGANRLFRKYSVNRINYCVQKIFDFNNIMVFDDIHTRYGLVYILRDKEQTFPIEYEIWEKTQWIKYYAKPLFQKDDYLSVFKEKDFYFNFEPITIKKYSQPRQGINTCGANHIFIFDNIKDINYNICEVSNKYIKTILPKHYIYPLITSKNFTEENAVPKKWVLLPYDKNTGKPLNIEQIKKESLLWEYLNKHKEFLYNRKGTLIKQWINKDIWWSLLGVGEYNFYSYKIVWEAYGRKEFIPKIFSGEWQANQSLQAFIPVKDKQEANRILNYLSNDFIQQYLLSNKMEGTTNWSQPGRIKKILKLSEY